MKKKVKYAILGIIVLAIAGVLTVNAMQPLSVDTVTINLSQAEVYFTELGHVQEDRQVDVFSLVGGEITSVHVVEGQFVQKGDILATVDSSNLHYEIEQIRMSNLALHAQIDNLSVEESQVRAGQLANRNVLQSELGAITARERMSNATEADQQRALEENKRLQNILIEQSYTNVQNALSDFETARGLFNAGVITQVELDASEQALDNHRTALASNEQNLEIISIGTGSVDQSEHFAALRRSTQAQISGIDSSLAQLSTEPMQRHFSALIESNNLAIANLERMISSSTIISPVSGTIASLPVNYTNILSPSTPVARIRARTDNFVEVMVSTANVGDLSVGDMAELTFIQQSGDVFYTGTVYSIDAAAEATISILGVEERRVSVLIEPDNPSDSFRSGFDVDVRFITYSAADRITIPRTAIFEEAYQSMVYVIENGLAVARPITVGARLRTEAVVESGLDIGDVVIRNASQSGLSNGARVSH